MNHNLLKWLLRGFVFCLGALVLAASLLVSQSSQAHDIGNPNTDRFIQGVPAGEQRSDDPLQRAPQLAANMPVGQNNSGAMTAGAVSQEPRTDNPLGVMGGPVEAGIPMSNPEAQARAANSGPAAAAARQEAPVTAMSVGGFSSPLVIPAADFRSDGYAPEGFMYWFSLGSLVGKDVFGTCLMAPAYLPNGVTLDEMWISAVDNDSTDNLTVNLYRVDNYAGTSAQVMGAATTTGAFSTIQTPYAYPISYGTISYPTYSYYVTACMEHSPFELYSVRIYYH